VFTKYFVEYQPIGNIAMDESAVQHGIAVAAGKVVERYHIDAFPAE
jgi:hypothetical protein